MKYWEILLTEQHNRGKSGLTFPFLIGSQKYLPETHIKQNIKELILEIISSQSFETCIRHCMGTQTFILEIKNPNNKVYFPIYNDNEQSNLSVSIFSKDDLGDNIDILIENLIEMFQDKIDDEYFSAEPNVDDRIANWKPFSENDDIPFIKNSFKSI